MTWRTEVSELPDLSPAEFDFSLPTTGLVIVDMQFVDAHRDYGLGASLRESHPNVWDYYFARVEGLVVPNCRRLLNAFREKELRVIHLTIGPVLDDGSDMVRLRRPRTAPGLTPLLHHQGTFEHGILPEVAPLDGELVINKTSRSAFNSTAIERVLHNLGLETLVVAGVSTSSCVETTARDAADRGFQVVIVEDATAELDEPSHEATLRQWAVRWGRVWTTDETLNELSRAAAGTNVGV
ncbi:MAG: cysteine hydrolase [Actinomycetia bacterium]|nr:cysteine hydrolase [Actinomycetes bacterium]